MVGCQRVSVVIMWLITDRRSRSARSLAGDPCHVQPSWNAAPPAGTSIGTHSTSANRSGGHTSDM